MTMYESYRCCCKFLQEDVWPDPTDTSEEVSDKDLERIPVEYFMDDSADTAFMYGAYFIATHIDKYYNRYNYRDLSTTMSGLEWVEQKLADRKRCYNMFRMTPDMFYSLHDLLVDKYELKSSTKSTSIEALGMFLWMCGAPQSVRQAEDIFERSLGTVHNMFHKVLASLLKLASNIIKPRDPQFTTLHGRLRNPRFYPYFNDCIGAIDGTHIPVQVSKDLLVQHMCRHHITTQNVMACCDFDMIFTFVLVGWPGSVHDMRVFHDAMSTYGHVFPHPPPGTQLPVVILQCLTSMMCNLQVITAAGKYYLVDSGYANRIGYLAPYKGTKYHITEFQNAPEPEGKEEVFNYAHSSLRNVIERSFGVLKQKWRILKYVPCYPCEIQTHIIVACMALHNYIRLAGLRDKHFGRCDRDENYVPPEAYEDQPPEDEAPSYLQCEHMNAFRDTLALELLHRA